MDTCFPRIEDTHKWLVTGAAGFIGSNLCFELLTQGQTVVALDNLSTGYRKNIDDIALFAKQTSGLFTFIDADVRSIDSCRLACTGVDYVLHQAALGSVPRSIANPLSSHDTNVNGFVNMLEASVLAKVKRFVYASSSSVYGDHPSLPKMESNVGSLLSPYAATKAINETYASVFQRIYGINCIGLRYFNVFGPRQDPNGAYAAVIPRWISAATSGGSIEIFGDGRTSRDFCYIDNAVQANILAALSTSIHGTAEVYNIAVSEQTSLLQLAELIIEQTRFLRKPNVESRDSPITFCAFREGDVMHSLADISKAVREIGYRPSYRINEGLVKTILWYLQNS